VGLLLAKPHPIVVALLAVDVGYVIYLQVYGTQHGVDTTVPQAIPVY